MNKKNIYKTAEKLAARPYVRRLIQDITTDGGPIFLAINPEFDICKAQGETPIEAFDNLDAVRVDCIAHLLEHKLPVPEPEKEIKGSYTTVANIKAEDIIYPGFEDVTQPNESVVLSET